MTEITDPEETYKSLFSIEDIGQYEIDEAIEFLRSLIDVSSYLHKIEGLERAIKLSGRAFRWDLTQDQSVLLHYHVARAWRSLKTIRRKDDSRSWESQKDEIENEILHLRGALKRCGSKETAREMRQKILDDLGNALGYIGRFVEAVECWNEILEINPSNPLARGNRGIGLAGYSRALYNQDHDASKEAVSTKEALLRAAYSDIKAALLSDPDDDARGRFQEYMTWLESVLSPEWLKSKALNSEMLGPEALQESIEANNPSLGSSDEEQSYRKWCLDNRLLLNPLNDLGPVAMATEDSLAPPEMMAGIRGGPGYIECLNELKQEFASARYIYYQGISSGRPHFSDRKVILINTPDYPAYSLAIEEVKAAFRIFYSMFDKIACLLDDYLGLGTTDREIRLKSLWYRMVKKDRLLRQDFQQNDNWPLKGLFWLSKDLYDERQVFKEFMEPDARRIYDIWDHLEHRYLNVSNQSTRKAASSALNASPNSLSYTIQRCDFEDMTLGLIKTVRAALIYLLTAINHQEQHCMEIRAENITIMGSGLDIIEDDWKI